MGHDTVVGLEGVWMPLVGSVLSFEFGSFQQVDERINIKIQNTDCKQH